MLYGFDFSFGDLLAQTDLTARGERVGQPRELEPGIVETRLRPAEHGSRGYEAKRPSVEAMRGKSSLDPLPLEELGKTPALPGKRAGGRDPGCKARWIRTLLISKRRLGSVLVC